MRREFDQVRVLIVDDSPTMRKLIRKGLEVSQRIKVIGEAGNALQARDAVKNLSPDVMTLDVEMPGMNGIAFLRRLMEARPMPVIMVSSMTKAGSDATIAALGLGAIDCVEKPKFGGAETAFEKLVSLIEVAATAKLRSAKPQAKNRSDEGGQYRPNGKVVLIGASTGGVEALETLLTSYPVNCPATVITQHMPEQFTQSFAARLNALARPEVKLASPNCPLVSGVVYLAPGGAYHTVVDENSLSLRLAAGEKMSGHRPSIDALFRSAVPHARQVISVILTGMGRDGAAGMQALHDAGAYCLGQDEETSIVYGMPRQAFEMGAIDLQLALEDMANHILEKTKLIEVTHV